VADSSNAHRELRLPCNDSYGQILLTRSKVWQDSQNLQERTPFSRQKLSC